MCARNDGTEVPRIGETIAKRTANHAPWGWPAIDLVPSPIGLGSHSRQTLPTQLESPKSSTLRDSTLQGPSRASAQAPLLLVPSPRFSIVQSDPCQPEKFVRQHVINIAGALRGRHCIDVVKECKQMFSRQQLRLDLLQRIMDGEAKEERHQRVSLLASFMLVDLHPANGNTKVARTPF